MKKQVTLALMTVLMATACNTLNRPAESLLEYKGTGEVVDYHANGKVRQKAEYVDGQLVASSSYFASGTQKSRVQYQDGNIHNATYYFSSGKVRSEIVGK